MPVIADLKEELADLFTFKYIAGAFTEASAVKLRKIRAQFEKNTQFYAEITKLYRLIEKSAQKMALAKQRQVRSKRTLCIALSSNQRFFGNLNLDVVRAFIAESEKISADRIVVGSTAIEYLKSIHYAPQYEPVVFPKDTPNNEELRFFLYKFGPYNTVLVYYPKFVSFLRQSVGVTDITQREQSIDTGMDEMPELLFEPEIDKMAIFFQNQVRHLLFRRVLLETELARTAARLLSMSQAEERAEGEILLKRAYIRKFMRSFVNAQLLETFAGMKKWKRY